MFNQEETLICEHYSSVSGIHSVGKKSSFTRRHI